MKQKYEKPRIVIEDFVANNSFAAGCSTVLTFSTSCGTTGYPELDIVVNDGFFNDKCSIPVDDAYDGYCLNTVSNPIIAS